MYTVNNVCINACMYMYKITTIISGVLGNASTLDFYGLL